MLRELAVPFADTRAADLRLSLDLPALSAVDVRALRCGRAQVEMRLLRASHQVVVRHDGTETIETLACLVSGEPAGSGRHEATISGGTHRIDIDIRRLHDEDFAGAVRRLVEECTDDDHALVGRFPGHPLATTGIVMEPGAGDVVRWRTWHAYPQESTLVVTRSQLSLAAATETVGIGA